AQFRLIRVPDRPHLPRSRSSYPSPARRSPAPHKQHRRSVVLDDLVVGSFPVGNDAERSRRRLPESETDRSVVILALQELLQLRFRAFGHVQHLLSTFSGQTHCVSSLSSSNGSDRSDSSAGVRIGSRGSSSVSGYGVG